jgi:hypothetical protein
LPYLTKKHKYLVHAQEIQANDDRMKQAFANESKQETTKVNVFNLSVPTNLGIRLDGGSFFERAGQRVHDIRIALRRTEPIEVAESVFGIAAFTTVGGMLGMLLGCIARPDNAIVSKENVTFFIIVGAVAAAGFITGTTIAIKSWADEHQIGRVHRVSWN